MPTPIAYVLVAMFVGPAMIQAGFPLLATHMFLFYFAIKSGSTPPVAVVAAVGAGIAGADFWKTAVKATVFSLASTLIAFGFLYNPSLLLIGDPLFIIVDSLAAFLAPMRWPPRSRAGCLPDAAAWKESHCSEGLCVSSRRRSSPT